MMLEQTVLIPTLEVNKMTNPRKFKLASDDTIWLYTTHTPPPGSSRQLLSLLNVEVFSKLGKCQAPPAVTCLSTQYRFPLDPAIFHLAGICGTEVVIISEDSTDSLTKIHELFGAGLEITSFQSAYIDNPHLRNVWVSLLEKDNQVDASSDFWEDFEVRLDLNSQKSEPIEFCIDSVSKRMYIHIDFGKNKELANDYYSAIKDIDKSTGFKDWLIGNKGTSVPRILWEVDLNGIKKQVTNINIQAIMPRNLRFSAFDIEAMECLGNCKPAICSMAVATVQRYDKALAILEADLEIVVRKPYCEDDYGNPCPPPPPPDPMEQ